MRREQRVSDCAPVQVFSKGGTPTTLYNAPRERCKCNPPPLVWLVRRLTEVVRRFVRGQAPGHRLSEGSAAKGAPAEREQVLEPDDAAELAKVRRLAGRPLLGPERDAFLLGLRPAEERHALNEVRPAPRLDLLRAGGRRG